MIAPTQPSWRRRRLNPDRTADRRRFQSSPSLTMSEGADDEAEDVEPVAPAERVGAHREELAEGDGVTDDRQAHRSRTDPERRAVVVAQLVEHRPRVGHEPLQQRRVLAPRRRSGRPERSPRGAAVLARMPGRGPDRRWRIDPWADDTRRVLPRTDAVVHR